MISLSPYISFPDVICLATSCPTLYKLFTSRNEVKHRHLIHWDAVLHIPQKLHLEMNWRFAQYRTGKTIFRRALDRLVKNMHCLGGCGDTFVSHPPHNWFYYNPDCCFPSSLYIRSPPTKKEAKLCTACYITLVDDEIFADAESDWTLGGDKLDNFLSSPRNNLANLLLVSSKLSKNYRLIHKIHDQLRDTVFRACLLREFGFTGKLADISTKNPLVHPKNLILVHPKNLIFTNHILRGNAVILKAMHLDWARQYFDTHRQEYQKAVQQWRHDRREKKELNKRRRKRKRQLDNTQKKIRHTMQTSMKRARARLQVDYSVKK